MHRSQGPSTCTQFLAAADEVRPETRRRADTVLSGLGEAFGMGTSVRHHLQVRNSEESENCTFELGLPGHYKGTFVKGGG